jgi:hypothetical protein
MRDIGVHPNQFKTKTTNQINLNRKLQKITFSLNRTYHFSSKSHDLFWFAVKTKPQYLI